MRKIRNIRIERGMTQYELANKLKLKSKSAISMWENGERTPSAAMIPQIAKALSCTIDELFADTDECNGGENK